jgi:hypothetical protein
MDELLKRALRAGDSGPSTSSGQGPGPCLEPEQFAAWADGGLSADDARAVELHLSNCARCQAMAAAFATSDVEAAGVSGNVVPITAKRPIRWALPMAAGTIAATLLVWFATSGNQPQPVSEMAAKLDAPSSAPPAAPAQPTAPADTAARSASQLADASRESRQDKQLRSEARGGVSSAETQKRVRTDAPPLPPPPPAPAPIQPAAGAATFRSSDPQSAAATKPVAPPVRTVSVAPPPPSSINVTRDGVMAESIVVEAKAIAEFSSPPPLVAQESVGLAPARTAASGGGGGGRGGGAAAGRGGGAAGATVAGGVSGNVSKAESADAPTTGWRIFERNVVQRSRDGGVSWQPAQIERDLPEITTGVAPSKTVCWLIGRAGLVLVSSDAVTFRRVATPANVDLRFVQATDALNATVTAADGRKFTTADGGLTWR